MKRCVLLFLLIVVGCGNASRVVPSTEEPQGVAKITLLIPASIPLELVRRVEYEVTGSGIDEPITGTMAVSGDSAKAFITGIPAGARRVFEVSSFCDEDIITYSGSGTGDVEYRQTVQVVINVNRRVGALTLEGSLPDNTTRIEFTITAPDLAAPIVKDLPIDGWTNSYRLIDIPTGTQREVAILAYDTSKENVTAEGRITASVRHDVTTQVNFTSTAGTGSVDLVARFPE